MPCILEVALTGIADDPNLFVHSSDNYLNAFLVLDIVVGVNRAVNNTQSLPIENAVSLEDIECELSVEKISYEKL